MARAGGALVAALSGLALWASSAGAFAPPSPWDGVNPFRCQLQQAGFEPTGPDPGADPYCVEFDKRRQNLTELGVVQFLLREPARVAAASPKCFYFQSDHWRGSVVQDDASTKTYEWDGHYFFDKARGEGGAWVTNFNINGMSGNPAALPGFPPDYAPYFGYGTGGFRTHNDIPGDPRCVERAGRERNRVYNGPGPAPRCMAPGGPVTPAQLGPVRIGDTEAEVRRSLGPPTFVKRGFLRWCVQGRGRYLVGQRSDRSGELGEDPSERTVLIVARSTAWRYRGLGIGSSVRSLRRALPHARRAFRYGATTVYLERRGAPVLFGVRARQVRFIGVRDTAAVRSGRALRTYLERAR